MKKRYLITLVLLLTITTIQTPLHAQTMPTLLLYIKDSTSYYVLSFTSQKTTVKAINENIYFPIPCLNNTYASLKEINFHENYSILANTIEKLIDSDISYYAIVDLDEIINKLNLTSTTYDTYTSLQRVLSDIQKNMNLDLLLHYKEYIDTNLNLDTLYTLYKYIKNKNYYFEYYTLTYYIYNKYYIPMDKTFHLHE